MEACCKPGARSEHAQKGHVESLDGLEAYVAGAEDAKQAVIIITDVFGFDVPYVRKIVDQIAAAGYVALLPDVLDNDPLGPITDIAKDFPPWLQKHPPEGAYAKLDAVFGYLKKKGVQKVGIIGFCWGGKVAVLAAGSSNVNAAVALHPSFVSASDAAALQQPTLFIVPEGDRIFPKELVDDVRKHIAADPKLANSCEVSVWEGVNHGFACRPDVNSEKAVADSQKAINGVLEWFNKKMI